MGAGFLKQLRVVANDGNPLPQNSLRAGIAEFAGIPWRYGHASLLPAQFADHLGAGFRRCRSICVHLLAKRAAQPAGALSDVERWP